MQETHHYRSIAWWASGLNGIAKSESAPNAIHFAAPPQFGGMEGRWTPEHLLLTSIASCFTTTFQTIAEYSKFQFRDLQVEAEGEVSKTASGYRFLNIVLHPTLSIIEESQRERAHLLLNKAKSLCLVSKCLAVEPAMDAKVEVLRPVPVDTKPISVAT